ncbi:MAG: hypothetical protein IJT12_03500 [Paludibacteraceae bacterium]|nr:hypothetical protein [Paludibacteraceae bacterium]
MKRIFIALCAIYPLFAFADIIVTFDNGNIEDVTVVSVGVDEVVYKQGGTQKTIASSQVEGVLYNDGRFITPPKKMAVSEASETTSDDTWAIDDAPSDDTQATSSRRSQKPEKKERSGGNSEVGQAFKEAGVAIKDAFTTMFDAMGKKKDKTQSANANAAKKSANANTDAESNQASSASDDGW